jgi:hypothetical protein
LPDPVLLRVRVATRVLELTVRAAAGDLAAQAELEALAALLERHQERGMTPGLAGGHRHSGGLRSGTVRVSAVRFRRHQRRAAGAACSDATTLIPYSAPRNPPATAPPANAAATSA